LNKEEDLIDQVVIILAKCFNGTDWENYLNSLPNRKEVLKELKKILGGGNEDTSNNKDT